jgi:ankyrin repeat protein
MNVDNAKKLIHAIFKDDIVTASSLISSGTVNLNGEPWPLHCAAEIGRVEIITLLLDAGADVNTVDEIRMTSCHVSIEYNQFDALKLLVERGAKLDVVDSDGHSLLATVAQYGKSERFAILLLDAGAPIDHLSSYELMMLGKSVAVLKRLMARDVDFNAMRDDFSRSLFHYVALSVTCEDDFRLLVNVCGANDAVHAVDSNGKMPLHWASSNGNYSVIRVLVELGAEIDRHDNDVGTALHNAAVNVQPTCLELLLALGADVSLVNNNGMTACHLATTRRMCDTLSALVAVGGDLDRPSNKGETPRMISIRERVALPTPGEIETARQRIAKSRLDLVRERAFQICVGLHPLNINALELCEIMMHSFGALGSLIAIHQWWAIAVRVKHFRDRKQQSSTSTTRTTNSDKKTQ